MLEQKKAVVVVVCWMETHSSRKNNHTADYSRRLIFDSLIVSLSLNAFCIFMQRTALPLSLRSRKRLPSQSSTSVVAT